MNLLEMINMKHQNKYDYFYLPMDLKVKHSFQLISFVDLM